MSKKKVLVAMSGGVDSSVALSLLLDEGYECIGVTMKLWENKDPISNVVRNSNCNTVEAINGAKLVCDRLGVHHYTLDFMDIFKKNVVDDFSEEYLRGRTPNPCVRCNSFVKWDTLLQQADIFGIDYISTGHYARVQHKKDASYLLKGADTLKDQSYMLWQINPDALKRTLLPLGEITKAKTREYAKSRGLETAQTPESMDLCFVSGDDYSKFLNEIMPEKMNLVTPGDIVDEAGEVVGEHTGFTNYTIGQRKGIGLAFPEPRYVKRINPMDNSIVIAQKDAMYADHCYASQLNWFVEPPIEEMATFAQIRYNSKGSNVTVVKEEEDYRINFSEPQLAVTPGQSIVFYEDKKLIGGGIIEVKN
jgi:tRNA-specific 2-thiouridylase